MMAISTLISTFAGIAIIRLHQVAVGYLFAHIEYENLKNSAYRIQAISESIRAQGYAIGANYDHIKNARRDAYSAIDTLREHNFSGNNTARLGALFSTYDSAVEKEFDFASKRYLDTNNPIYKNEITPAFLTLDREIETTEEKQLRSGGLSEMLAAIWTFLLIFFAFFVMTYIVWRYGEARNENEKLAVERDVSRLIYERFDIMARYARGIAFILGPQCDVIYVSAGCEPILMLKQSEIMGRKILNLINEKELSRFQAAIDRAMEKENESVSVEITLQRLDGDWVSTEAVITNMFADSSIQGLLVTCRDINERKVFERQLAHQAFHDPLTDLPNRALFMERLQHALSKSKRKCDPVGVLFVDLDNFKLINDSLGHEAGDEMLIDVARRLKECVRDADTVARLAGDEFTILIDDASDGDTILEIGRRIVEVLQLPANIDGREVFTTASVGIATSSGDYDSPDDLLRDADTAMYQAKSKGKSDVAVFDRSMNKKAIERLELESDIRKGIRNGEFLVHYQPIFSMKTGEMIELEALLRWNHPQKGMILPGVFIPVAEENGLIIPLGKFVLEQACKDAKAFREGLSERADLRMSINLSSRQLLQPELVNLIRHQLEVNQIPPDCLKIEITESVMMSDTEITIPRLQLLKNLGVHLAIDDFGTGYSSMAYIRTLPIDSLKIDRSFVQHISENEDDRAIVNAIVSLGKTLDLHITSEGIETEEQLKVLTEMGCDDGQGFHLARPASIVDIGKLSGRILVGGSDKLQKMPRMKQAKEAA